MFIDFYHHLAAQPFVVRNLITKNVSLYILLLFILLFLFLPPTLAFSSLS